MSKLPTIATLAMVALLVSAASAQEKPHARTVQLARTGAHDLPLLGGPPETVTMKSGLVTLPPGQSVGKHSTASHEEMLVILEGKGEMKFEDGTSLPVDPDHILYCPPQTAHDVTNTGAGVLRYVYIVAAAKP